LPLRCADAAGRAARKISQMKQGGNSRRGMVLVTVLWSISLLSALAMAASVTFRSYAGVMAVERDRVQGDALLTAGLETAAGFIDPSNKSPLAQLETTITLDTGAVRVNVSDEGGRIDIGRAPLELIASMLRSIGAPDTAARKLAQRIVERRDTGRPANSDNTNRPANAVPGMPGSSQPFTDVRQLGEIPGMAPEWIAAIAPLTTVFGDSTVNPLTAPPGVIAALPGVDSQRAASFLTARSSTPADANRLVRILGPAQPYLAVKPQRVASVDLTAALASGYTAAAHAIIVVLPQDVQPYRVLLWTPIPYAKVSIGDRSMAQR
jgi:general secretion pathway protein K